MEGQFIANPTTINLNDILKAVLELKEVALELKAKQRQQVAIYAESV